MCNSSIKVYAVNLLAASKSWKYKGLQHFWDVSEADFAIHFTGRLPEHYHSFETPILGQVVEIKGDLGGWLHFSAHFLVAFFGKPGAAPIFTPELPFLLFGGGV